MEHKCQDVVNQLIEENESFATAIRDRGKLVDKLFKENCLLRELLDKAIKEKALCDICNFEMYCAISGKSMKLSRESCEKKPKCMQVLLERIRGG